MKIPELKIGSYTARVPIVQGGMGVRVSKASLAAAVANQGGVGTISSIGLGDVENSKRHYEQESREALQEEIREARSLTDGLLAVNIMGVLSNADDMVKASADEGAQIIVFGAGLPMKLPAILDGREAALVPIISSARVAKLILKTWDRRYKRTVDAFILEGPLAGGHLGFSEEQLASPEENSLELMLPVVLETIAPYEQKYGIKIPVITAGGVFTGQDIGHMLKLGASGVQMGTRFVCTHECGVSDEFKQAYIDAKEEDIIIINSPVGMPARAIRTRFLEELTEDSKTRCPYRCLTACKADDARYCIAKALLNSYFGDTEGGVVFCGQNAYRVDKNISVKELFDELLTELKAVPEDN